MTQIKFISSFIQHNVIIFFKLTIGTFVLLLINIEVWFHPLNMQTGQNKDTCDVPSPTMGSRWLVFAKVTRDLIFVTLSRKSLVPVSFVYISYISSKLFLSVPACV